MTQKIIRVLFYLLPFAFPLYLIKIPVSHGTIPLLDLYLIAFISISVFSIHKNNKTKDFLLFIKTKKIQAIFSFLYFLGFIFSYFLNISKENAFDGAGIIKSHLVFPILTTWIVSFFSNQTFLSKNKFYLSYFAYTVLLGILGLIYKIIEETTYDHRLSTIFDSPNQLAMSLVPGILICIFLFFNTSEKFPALNSSRRKIILFFCLIFLFFSLYQTHSQGAWLGLILALPLMFSFDLWKKISSFIIPCCIIVLLFLPGISSILKIINYTPSTPPTSSDSRLAIYLSGEKILKNNLFFGIGPGNFQKDYLAYQKYFAPYPQWAVPHAHNMFFHIWIEGGSIAILSLIYIIHLRIIQKKHKNTPLEMLPLIILVYFLIHGLVDMPIWKNDFAILFWLLII